MVSSSPPSSDYSDCALSIFSGLPLLASGAQIGTEINLATASQVRLHS